MSADLKIYADAGQLAMLNDGAAKLTDCATLQESVLAWDALPSPQKPRPKPPGWGLLSPNMAPLQLPNVGQRMRRFARELSEYGYCDTADKK